MCGCEFSQVWLDVGDEVGDPQGELERLPVGKGLGSSCSSAAYSDALEDRRLLISIMDFGV